MNLPLEYRKVGGEGSDRYSLATDPEDTYQHTPAALTVVPADYLPDGGAEVFAADDVTHDHAAGMPKGYAIPVDVYDDSAPGDLLLVHVDQHVPPMLLRVVRDDTGVPLALRGVAIPHYLDGINGAGLVHLAAKALAELDARAVSDNAAA